MRIDWVPFSASALVAGSTALAVGSFLMPSSDSSGEALRIAEQDGGIWLAVAGLYFLASVAMTAGLPCILTLIDRRTGRLGLTAVGVFSIGCIGIAGFAMLLAFFRALALDDAIKVANLDELTRDLGLGIFLYGWIVAFYLGELLLALALLRSRSVPRWVPLLLVLHVALLPLTAVLPDRVGSASILLIAVAFSAVGITANNRHLLPS